MTSISIVIPAYNEEERLPGTLDSILAYLKSRNWPSSEIIVVDDGSQDETVAVVESYSAKQPQVRLLRNPGNCGKGYSVRHGVLDAKSDWILFTDADLSAPIEELDKLLAAVQPGVSVVMGSRGLDRSLIRVHQSAFREFAGRLFNLTVRTLAGLPFADTQCGFKLFEARAARRIFNRLQLERFGFDVEVLFIARRLGLRVVEIPVSWSHASGTKVSMLSDSMNMFLDLLRIRWHEVHGRYQ